MRVFGPLPGVLSGPDSFQTTAVLVAGIGLGPWFWDRWLPAFHAAGIRTLCLTLPGHEPEGAPDGDLPAAVAAVTAAVAAFVAEEKAEAPVLIGHSLGALVVMLAAQTLPAKGVVAICPLIPGKTPRLPDLSALKDAPRLLTQLLRGQPLAIRPETYRKTGFSEVDDATAAESLPRMRPWPPRLTRSLLRPPAVPAGSMKAPLALFLGKKDPLVRWQDARVLGDLHEGVVWRYDDLGHSPTLEPGGERMCADLVSWVKDPVRPRIIEFEAFGPGEGVGTDVRTQRRGDARKKRSAYGQKRSAR